MDTHPDDGPTEDQVISWNIHNDHAAVADEQDQEPSDSHHPQWCSERCPCKRGGPKPEPHCNHDAAAVAGGVCECGHRVSEDPRVQAARDVATGGPRGDVLLPAPMLVKLYYEVQTALRGLLAVHDEAVAAAASDPRPSAAEYCQSCPGGWCEGSEAERAGQPE